MEDAAALIAHHPLPITGVDWYRKIGKEFAEVFEDQSEEQGKKAFLNLMSVVKNSAHLLEVAGAVHGEGNDRLAFQLLNSIPLTHFLEKIQNQVRAATFLKNYAGSEQAIIWLKSKVSGKYRQLPSLFLYLFEEYDMLWKYSRSPDDGIWLVLAAASLKDKNMPAKKRNRMMSYYDLPGVEQNEYGLVGSHLLGKSSEKQVIQAMISPKKRCEHAYYLGVKAESEGRFRDAVSWYRSAVETGLRMNFEYVYSLRALHRLIEEEKSLLHRKSASSRST